MNNAVSTDVLQDGALPQGQPMSPPLGVSP